jgi:hypothetical protein
MQKCSGQIAAILLVCAVPVLGCAALRKGHSRSPGVEAAVTVVLRNIDTPNGPLIEIVGDPDCTGLGESTHSPAVPCVSIAGDSAIREFANARGLRLVRKSEALPPCRWLRGDVPGQRGLRVLVNRPIDMDGRVRISVRLMCGEGRAQFSESGIYELGLVGGTWKIVRVLDRSVS